MSEAPDTNNLPVAEDPAVVRIRGCSRFHKFIVIFVTGWVSFILEKIIKLDSILGGLKEGGVGGVFVAPFLLIITLPLAFLGSRIGSWEKWRKHQLWFTMGLPALYLIVGLAEALHGRAFPQARFQRFTGVEFPRNAEVEQCVINDGFGPFADPLFLYELTCPATETDRLIRELNLTDQSSASGSSSLFSRSGITPTRSGWIIDEKWSGTDKRNGNFYVLRTDATRTKLWLMCAGI